MPGQTMLNTATVPLAVDAGGTGIASATAYAVQCGGTTSTGAHQSIASVGTSGQVLTSNGAAALPTFQAVPGSTGLAYVDVTSSPQAMVGGNIYLTDNGASQVTYTLPTSCAKGLIFQLVGFSSGGWVITQAASQQIVNGNLATTAGVTGTLTSAEQHDGVTLMCTTADTIYQVIGITGNPVAA
jgi:hypothetical protein